MRIIIRRMLTILSVLLLALLIGLVLELFDFRNKKEVAAQQQAEAITTEFETEMSAIFKRVNSEAQATADRLMGTLRTDTLEMEPLIDLLRETALEVPESFGVTTCVEPFAFSPDVRLYCPYYDKKSSSVIQIDEVYDYSVRSPRRSGMSIYVTEARDGQHTQPTLHSRDESPPIVDSASLGAFISAETTRAETLKIDAPISIPTGIFIEGMEFADSYNVNIGGVMWQRYPVALVDGEGDDDVITGVHFPQTSPFAESAYIEEVSRERIEALEGQEQYVLISYDFRRRSGSISNMATTPSTSAIWISSSRPHPIATPSYSSPISTGMYPPAPPDCRAWIRRSNSRHGDREDLFQFHGRGFRHEFRCRYGRGQCAPPDPAFQHPPEALPHQRLRTYLIPIGVTLALIYILILSCEKTDARQGIVESMAAFFFVLIFSHIDLRKNIETADLMFMEHFYFATIS